MKETLLKFAIIAKALAMLIVFVIHTASTSSANEGELRDLNRIRVDFGVAVHCQTDLMQVSCMNEAGCTLKDLCRAN